MVNEKDKLVQSRPIDVYCKFNYGERSNQITLKIPDKRTLVLSCSADTSNNGSKVKQDHYLFKRVFREQTSLKKVFDCVAFPLVQDIILGKNGLIFINGATSERNQVILGTSEDIGILFRITDVIFNSIQNFHATKFLFKPNRLNGFKVQSMPEALQNQQKKLSIFNIKPKCITNFGEEWKNRTSDSRTVDELEYDAQFAIFVSYIEICEHSIYDLLEDFDTGVMKIKSNSKVLVEDNVCNTYVHDINEVEVRNSDELLQLFFQGQHKLTSRQDTHSRNSSHSIFTIYVVQALFDPFDSEIVKDETAVTVSQLSIVELGFNRMPLTSVAKTENVFSSENTNTSLGVLKKCFDAFRKSETEGYSKIIPYYEDELTYLCKPYFDGKGNIKMIICMNENYDYEKMTCLLQFAEKKKKVKKSWSYATLWSNSSSRASYDEILLQKAINNTGSRHEQSSMKRLNWTCPSSVIKSPEDDIIYTNLIDFLNKKLSYTKPLIQGLEKHRTDLKKNLVNVIQENEELMDTKKVLKLDLEMKTEQVIVLEKKVAAIDSEKDELEKKVLSLRNQVASIMFEVKKKDTLISNQNEKLRKIELDIQEKLERERNHLKSILEKKLFKKQIELERKMCINNKKFKMFKEIVNEGDEEANELGAMQLAQFSQTSIATSMSVSEAKSKCLNLTSVSSISTLMPKFCQSKNNLDSVQNESAKSDVSLDNISTHFYKTNQIRTSNASKSSPVVANIRHQKSHAGARGLWIVHEPKKYLYTSNILKPDKKKTKSFCKLELKDILKSKASKYALQYQVQNSEGEIETYLYKADITRSFAGGIQVIFSDVEIVKQEPPPCVS